MDSEHATGLPKDNISIHIICYVCVKGGAYIDEYLSLYTGFYEVSAFKNQGQDMSHSPMQTCGKDANRISANFSGE